MPPFVCRGRDLIVAAAYLQGSAWRCWRCSMLGRGSVSRILVLAPLLMLGACAGTDAYNAKSVAVPSSYRQLVARYLGPKIEGKLLSAEISRPGVWEGIGPGSRPIVSARWKVQGEFIQQTHTLLFLFADGQIAETMNPEYGNPAAGGAFAAALLNSVTCGKVFYVSFPDLRRGK